MNSTTLAPPLSAFLSQLAQCGPTDQDAVLGSLPPAQARALKKHLSGASASGAGDFAARLQGLTPAAAPVAQTRSEACESVAALELTALPAGLVATLLAGLSMQERQSLCQGLSPQCARQVTDLLAALPDATLARASEQLRLLLSASQGAGHFVVDAGQGASVQAPGAAAAMFDSIVNRVKSWVRV